MSFSNNIEMKIEGNIKFKLLVDIDTLFNRYYERYKLHLADTGLSSESLLYHTYHNTTDKDVISVIKNIKPTIVDYNNIKSFSNIYRLIQDIINMSKIYKLDFIVRNDRDKELIKKKFKELSHIIRIYNSIDDVDVGDYNIVFLSEYVDVIKLLKLDISNIDILILDRDSNKDDDLSVKGISEVLDKNRMFDDTINVKFINAYLLNDNHKNIG